MSDFLTNLAANIAYFQNISHKRGKKKQCHRANEDLVARLF